ncbi:MAG: endonuclease/exonuclease/phosphatase family protein, partial [Burkholderiales bacterium]
MNAQLGPECLRVATYNLHGCVGRDGVRNPQRIARVIAELACDTIGLQEVYDLESLARILGMKAVAGPPYVWHGRHVGNALLTRRPVLSMRHYDYSWGKHEPRTILDVELDVGGAPLRVFVAHFGVHTRERRFQVRKLLQLLRETPKRERVVVLGDINEWLPLGRPLRWLHEQLGHAPAERTFPARWPLLALDRVWVHPRQALLALEAYRSPLAAWASDHLPLRAIVAAQPPLQPRPPAVSAPAVTASALVSKAADPA